jgi:hypothetical protein
MDPLLIGSSGPIILKRASLHDSAPTADAVGEYFPLDYEFETPFDNIESAQEYLALLSRALDEAKQETEADIVREANSRIPRRRDALRLVLYKLEKLEQHIKGSHRLLNDLRTLRRLLLDERAESAISKDDRHF